ncbi:2-(1,2-epoxy-1,2-dihydrophenyl)acetyl-CoA isomerase [Lentibacillus persicus]|uniref:2-(1,2-epoxy-1,2-dihydrophenyl)acetyl-CoA isomerase n=1 Tax=Lentibacillus persicus TaxID=640948 RepID=A0A1I1SAW4_9BACI|nr:enoyl-CoA hydratase [Lentibacillus persicus]SFD43645.1 2-(1,2-epoxy-1,2-dihydrophenyl)acetyl-CoA isomerase [Lentibacillus persicus]
MTIVNTNFQNGVFKIILNRPDKINALNRDLALDLAKAVSEAESNPDVRAVLVYGNGKGFCAGGDLKDFGIHTDNPNEVKEFLKEGQEAVLGLYNMEKPVIAAVHGPAVGAGCNIAFACDIIIAEESAVFSEIFSQVGVIPDFGGLYFLPHKVGMHVASELVFTGKKLKANEAKEYGLINQVTTEGEALEKARKLASSLAQGPTKTLGMAKRIMHQAPNSSLEEILQLEAYGQAITFQSRDFKEGRDAFLEKRQPEFLGY